MEESRSASSGYRKAIVTEARLAEAVMHKKVDLCDASAPWGLSALAGATALSSCFSAQWGVTNSTILAGIGFFYGGLVQLIVALFHVAGGDGLGASLFGSFGAFWMANAFCLRPDLKIPGAYTSPEDWSKASGMLNIIMGIFVCIHIVASLRKGVAFVFELCMVSCHLFALGIGGITGNVEATKFGGYFGIIVSIGGFYLCLLNLLSKKELSRFHLWDCPFERLIGLEEVDEKEALISISNA